MWGVSYLCLLQKAREVKTVIMCQVDASDNALLQLPESLAGGSALLTLNLSSNRLSTAPGPIIAGLRNLTSLNLSQNLIGGSLPESIGCLLRCFPLPRT